MDTYTASPAAIGGGGGGVGLRAAFSHAIPSRLLMIRDRRCGCQGASSPSHGFALITTQSQQMSRTWDPLNRRGRYMTVYSGWRIGVGDREGMARESEGERGKGREK